MNDSNQVAPSPPPQTDAPERIPSWYPKRIWITTRHNQWNDSKPPPDERFMDVEYIRFDLAGDAGRELLRLFADTTNRVHGDCANDNCKECSRLEDLARQARELLEKTK